MPVMSGLGIMLWLEVNTKGTPTRSVRPDTDFCVTTDRLAGCENKYVEMKRVQYKHPDGETSKGSKAW